MAKLYYGNGKCSIEGSGITLVIIKYKGAVLIDDKTSNSHAITAHGNGITIFPIKPDPGELNELFEYTGELKIISVRNNGTSQATVHRVMDYTELLTGDTETMTINTEDLKVTHKTSGRVRKTELKQPYIKDLNTSDNNSTYYLENGDSYSGYYHISLVDNSIMTGRNRDESSQLLYIKQIDGNLVSTFNPTGIPPGIKVRKKQERDKKVSQNRSKKISRGRSY